MKKQKKRPTVTRAVASGMCAVFDAMSQGKSVVHTEPGVMKPTMQFMKYWWKGERLPKALEEIGKNPTPGNKQVFATMAMALGRAEGKIDFVTPERIIELMTGAEGTYGAKKVLVAWCYALCIEAVTPPDWEEQLSETADFSMALEKQVKADNPDLTTPEVRMLIAAEIRNHMETSSGGTRLGAGVDAMVDALPNE